MWVYQKFRYTAEEISLKMSCADPETFVWRAGYYRPYSGFAIEMAFRWPADLVGRICNNFEKNHAFYDKSMKLGTWLVDNNTNKLRVSATPKMSSNGHHLVFSKMAAFLNLFIIMSFLICKHNVFSVNFT